MTASLRDSEQTFAYPSEIPPDRQIAFVKPGRYLVLADAELAETHRFSPLFELPEPVKIGTRAKPYTVTNIVSMGVEFQSATEFVEHPAPTLEAAKVVEKNIGDRVVRYVAFDALPRGRYAYSAVAGEAVYLVDFGTRPSLPAATPANEEKAGKN